MKIIFIILIVIIILYFLIFQIKESYSLHTTIEHPDLSMSTEYNWNCYTDKELNRLDKYKTAPDYYEILKNDPYFYTFLNL